MIQEWKTSRPIRILYYKSGQNAPKIWLVYFKCLKLVAKKFGPAVPLDVRWMLVYNLFYSWWLRIYQFKIFTNSAKTTFIRKFSSFRYFFLRNHPYPWRLRENHRWYRETVFCIQLPTKKAQWRNFIKLIEYPVHRI